MNDVYEIQTLKDGRWMIEQRCRNEQEAIAEAHDLFESRAFQSVKVIKEIFDQRAKLYKETVVYRLPASNGATVQSRRPQRATAQASAPAQTPRRAAPPKKRSILDFLKD